jgi:hypothetical protein
MKTVLHAIRDDNYLRVLDLRKNKLTTSVLTNTTDYDFLKSLQANESLVNIDFRNNDGFDQNTRYKLSLIMMRNIDALKNQGLEIPGSWLNKEVLMFNEASNKVQGYQRSPTKSEKNQREE